MKLKRSASARRAFSPPPRDIMKLPAWPVPITDSTPRSTVMVTQRAAEATPRRERARSVSDTNKLVDQPMHKTKKIMPPGTVSFQGMSGLETRISAEIRQSKKIVEQPKGNVAGTAGVHMEPRAAAIEILQFSEKMHPPKYVRPNAVDVLVFGADLDGSGYPADGPPCSVRIFPQQKALELGDSQAKEQVRGKKQAKPSTKAEREVVLKIDPSLLDCWGRPPYKAQKKMVPTYGTSEVRNILGIPDSTDFKEAKLAEVRRVKLYEGRSGKASDQSKSLPPKKKANFTARETKSLIAAESPVVVAGKSARGNGSSWSLRFTGYEPGKMSMLG